MTLAHYRVGGVIASACEPHGNAELRLTPLLDDLGSYPRHRSPCYLFAPMLSVSLNSETGLL